MAEDAHDLLVLEGQVAQEAEGALEVHVVVVPNGLAQPIHKKFDHVVCADFWPAALLG